MSKKSYVGMTKEALDRGDIDTANKRLKEGLSYYGKGICENVEGTPTADIPLLITNLRAAADALEEQLYKEAPAAQEFIEWLQKNMRPECTVEMDDRAIIPFPRQK